MKGTKQGLNPKGKKELVACSNRWRRGVLAYSVVGSRVGAVAAPAKRGCVQAATTFGGSSGRQPQEEASGGGQVEIGVERRNEASAAASVGRRRAARGRGKCRTATAR